MRMAHMAVEDPSHAASLEQVAGGELRARAVMIELKRLPEEQRMALSLVAIEGKSYAEAELRFQKSRAGYIGNRTKGAIAFALGAFGVFHLALIAATVGIVIALAPVIVPWAATAVVTLALIVAGVVMLRLLKGRLDDIRDAFDDGDGE